MIENCKRYGKYVLGFREWYEGERGIYTSQWAIYTINESPNGSAALGDVLEEGPVVHHADAVEANFNEGEARIKELEEQD